MLCILDLLLLLALLAVGASIYPFVQDSYKLAYGSFSARELLEAKEAAREMFYFAYENYIRYAYPMDELDPINCAGRGHDHLNPFVILNSILISSFVSAFCIFAASFSYFKLLTFVQEEFFLFFF